MVNVPLHLWHRSDGGGGGGGGTSSSAAASSAGASSAAASSAATSWDGVGGAEASDAAGFLQCTCLEDASVAAASAAGVSGAAAAASAFFWQWRLWVRRALAFFCALLQIWHTRASASVATWSVASAVGSMSGAALVGGSVLDGGAASAVGSVSGAPLAEASAPDGGAASAGGSVPDAGLFLQKRKWEARPFCPLHLWEQCGQRASVELPVAAGAGGFVCASLIVAPVAFDAATSSSLSMRFAAATSRPSQAPFIAPPSSFC